MCGGSFVDDLVVGGVVAVFYYPQEAQLYSTVTSGTFGEGKEPLFYSSFFSVVVVIIVIVIVVRCQWLLPVIIRSCCFAVVVIGSRYGLLCFF